MLIRRSGTQVIGERQIATLPGEVDLAGAPDFTLGGLKVQPSILQVSFDGASRTIEPRVMQVLVLLATKRGSVVSRDQLIDCCWGGRVVGEDAINRCIAKVRRLGEESRALEVETIPRVGYRLLAVDGPATRPRSAAKLSRTAVIGLAAVLVVTLVLAAYRDWRSSTTAAQPKIAVLPFTSLNSDADTRNLAQSIAATVSTALVQTGAQMPDGNIATLEDARRSGAAIIVGGTVRRDGSTFRLTMRVVSAREGTTILSNQFDSEGSDGASLAGPAAAWLVPPVRMWSSFLPVERDPSITDEIMRIFLTRSSGDLLRAWQLSRSLATAQPRSGAAQLVFSLLTSDVLALIAPDQRRAAILSARQAALTAARLLPDPARPLAVLECHLTAPGWHILTATCDRRTRQAISANPNVPLLPFLFGWQLVEAGRFVEGQRFADMDLAQSPLGPGQLSLRIVATRMSRDDDADDVLPQLEERMRRYVGQGASAYFDFQLALANADVATADALLNGRNDAYRDRRGHPWDAMAAIPAGESRDITQVVVRALKSKAAGDVARMRGSCAASRPGDVPEDPAFSACLIGFTAAGDLDSAFALANLGYRDIECCSAAEQENQWLATGGVYNSRWQLFGKAMAPMRADPRFIELARRTGLLAYWKSGHPPDFCSFERAPVCQLINSN